MVNTIGLRETELALQMGKLYSPQEALSVGLVDQVSALDEVPAAVTATMKQWLKVPGDDNVSLQNSLWEMYLRNIWKLINLLEVPDHIEQKTSTIDTFGKASLCLYFLKGNWRPTFAKN